MFKIFAKVKQTNNNNKRMETTKVKFTEQQTCALDEQMYEIVRDRCTQKNSEWVEDECEVEIDGVLYIVEYEGDYEDWETKSADWYTPAEYDESCSYKVKACYYYDEETSERIDVETGRETKFNF